MDDAQDDEKLGRAEQKKEALREKQEFEALLKSPGWRRIEKWIERQIKARTDQVMLNIPSGIKSQLNDAYIRGEVCMAQTILTVVRTGHESAIAVAQIMEEEDVGSTDDPTADAEV